jgi:hypothetical protein
MRFILFLLAFTLALPAEAGRKSSYPPAPFQESRKPASKMPTKIMTFVCREEDGTENGIGIASMLVNLQDDTLGTFGMNLYLRSGKGYANKTLNGAYTSVPGGYVFRTRWDSSSDQYILINVHPRERTAFPGFTAKQQCEISGQLESN